MKDNNQIHIIQFSPYFPPHKWWVETVAMEIAENWIKHQLWDVVNIVFDVWQEHEYHYEEKWYKVFLLPSFDIIPNFPVPKIWKRQFWNVFSELKKTLDNRKNYRIISHTRFFLSSLIAWIFAKRNKIKWIHIEHGSDYVKLSSNFKSKISYIYDRLIWRQIFKKADVVLAISKACKIFIKNEFTNKYMQVFYRGILFPRYDLNKSGNLKLIYFWRLVYLKWVTDLIEAYIKCGIMTELVIIWDGDEYGKLTNKASWYNISFLWKKDREFIFEYLSTHHCICVNPSYQEWLPTTVIEWLMLWCPVIASDVWGTSEISQKDDLVLFEAWNINSLKLKILFTIEEYDRLRWKSKSTVKEKFSMHSSIENLYNFIK